MEIAITAIGTANPTFKQSQKNAAELISDVLHLKPAEKRLLKSIYKSTGIEYRHSVIRDYCKTLGEFEFFPNDPDLAFPSTALRMQLYKENALPLALHAIDDCFTRHGTIRPADITHVITISCTGMYAPGLDIEIVQKLQLPSSTQRTAINFMGCYGAFNGLKVANAICQSNPKAKVLMVSVELCSLHFQKNISKDNLIANAIFADGAAAVLLESQHQQPVSLTLKSFYCDLLPQTQQEMAWHIADSGFDIALSSYVPDAIENGIAIFMERLLKQSDLKPSDIDFYAIHPGGSKILQASESALGITAEQNQYSYSILRNFGNMSSATVLFVLKAIWDNLKPSDAGKHIFSCAFGPGLTLESAVLGVGL